MHEQPYEKINNIEQFCVFCYITTYTRTMNAERHVMKCWIQRRKPTRGGSVWTQVQQIFFNTSSTTDVLTTCGFSGFGSI